MCSFLGMRTRASRGVAAGVEIGLHLATGTVFGGPILAEP